MGLSERLRYVSQTKIFIWQNSTKVLLWLLLFKGQTILLTATRSNMWMIVCRDASMVSRQNLAIFPTRPFWQLLARESWNSTLERASQWILMMSYQHCLILKSRKAWLTTPNSIQSKISTHLSLKTRRRILLRNLHQYTKSSWLKRGKIRRKSWIKFLLTLPTTV